MSELPKTFDPAAIEARWYAHWETNGRFRPDRSDAEPFTIVIPPPNVTGSLHIGHALDLTLQDILIRHARLKGKDALWVVGTDHAGIATQLVVERKLAERQQKRTDFTREEFVAKVWEWKAESGGAITAQLRRLGASCDWANERFTMDEGFTRAVTKVFVQLYREGLIYRDKRLVNWDPKFRTAISDLEVETREVQGKFWHLHYPLADGSGSLSVATTRPETMLADMAVAVHPDDARYAALVGKQVRLPITGRLIPIVADEHADPALGSGAVKITPGHDFDDFEVGRRAGFKAAEMLNMLDAEARVVQTADGLIPDELLGLDRFEARARIEAMLEGQGLLEKVEDRTIQTPYGDRSGVVIEPWLTDQWYVDAATLAKPAIEAVRSGETRFVPETWAKTYFNWMENIQPWCVSRQLWWGHRIPAWYGPKREGSDAPLSTFHVEPTADVPVRLTGPKLFVAETQAEAVIEAQTYYGPGKSVRVISTSGPGFAGALHHSSEVNIWRDEDVLDTWFSSALWPFATLGWPELEEPAHPEPVEGLSFSSTHQERAGLRQAQPERNLLAKHYPTTTLVTGFDIIFFWVARMMMQGIHLTGAAPFHTVYCHGLVRDKHGQKMSKSKGNTVDPLGLIDRYGADALRFTMAAMESQGRDIKLDEKRIEGYRNFATKLWNAARFCQANGIGASRSIEPPAAALPVNRWIIGETVKTVQALDLALADLRFDESANLIYHFTWDRFCDWYLELIKPVLSDTEAAVISPLPPAGGDQGVGASEASLNNPTPQRPAGGSLTRKREGSEADETRSVAGWVLDQILVMLHPFMPFITEELWHALASPAHPRPYDLILAKWPLPDGRALDPEAGLEIEWLIRLIGEVRAARTELGVPPRVLLPAFVGDLDDHAFLRLKTHEGVLGRMARIASIKRERLENNVRMSVVVDELTIHFPLLDVIDVAAERARISKAAQAAAKERDSLAARLSNPSFVERAKPEAVEKARADHDEKAADAERYRAALARLG